MPLSVAVSPSAPLRLSRTHSPRRVLAAGGLAVGRGVVPAPLDGGAIRDGLQRHYCQQTSPSSTPTRMLASLRDTQLSLSVSLVASKDAPCPAAWTLQPLDETTWRAGARVGSFFCQQALHSVRVIAGQLYESTSFPFILGAACTLIVMILPYSKKWCCGWAPPNPSWILVHRRRRRGVSRRQTRLAAGSVGWLGCAPRRLAHHHMLNIRSNYSKLLSL